MSEREASCAFSVRLVEFLQPGGAPDVSAHAAGCAPCAEELRALEESHALLAHEVRPPSEEVLARVRARALAESPAPGRGSTALTLLGGIAAAAAVLAWAGVREVPDLAIAAALLCAGAFLLGPAAAAGRLRVAFVALAVPGVALAVLSQPGPESGGARCLGLGALVALGPLLATGVALLRRGISPAGGAFWGASAGVLATALFRLHCPYDGHVHALAFHATLVPILAGLGAQLARAYSKMPRSTTLATEK